MKSKEEVVNSSIELLKELVGKGYTKYRIAKETDIAEKTIGNYVNKINKPSYRNAKVLLDYYIEDSQILKEEKTIKGSVPYLTEDLVEVSYVPIKSFASFVESLYNTEYELETYSIKPEDSEDLGNGRFMVFDIEGDSMYPTIQSGSKILCEKIDQNNWEYAKGVVVVVYGKTLTVKRILKNNLYINNSITLKADNPTYGEVDIEKCEIRGIWQAKRVISMKIM